MEWDAATALAAGWGRTAEMAFAADHATWMGDDGAANGNEKAPPGQGRGLAGSKSAVADQWNCSSSVEPVSAFTLDEPPWITVVTSSK